MQKGKAEKQRKKTNTENIEKTPDSRERLTIHLTDDQLTDKSLNCREHRECRLSRASRVSTVESIKSVERVPACSAGCTPDNLPALDLAR